ncbi:hypothetical protein K8I61_16030 [bacterium]|nr:hypothetical protein [bacterium]
MTKTRNEISFVVLVAIAMFAAVFATATCGDDDDDDATVGGKPPGSGSGSGGGGDDDTADDDTADDDDDDGIFVAIIHNFETSTAETWGSILGSYGFNWITVNEPDAPATDFEGVDVILIDPDTEWFVASDSQAVADSFLPILGIGPGGYKFFENIGLSANWSNTHTFTYFGQVGFVTQNTAHQVFRDPFEFGYSDGDHMDVAVDNGRTDLYAIDLALAGGLVVIGTLDGDATRAAVAIESSRYMAWGFDINPDDVSVNGGQFLVNCLDYLSGFAKAARGPREPREP